MYDILVAINNNLWPWLYIAPQLFESFNAFARDKSFQISAWPLSGKN